MKFVKVFRVSVSGFALRFVCVIAIFSIVGCADKAGAPLTDIVLGSPVWSIPCTGCTQSESFNPQITLRQKFFVTSAVWSPDGKYLSIGSGFEGHITVYDTSSWTIISHLNREWAGDNNSVIQFTQNSQNLIMPRINFDFGDNVAIEMWNVKTGQISGVYNAIFASEASQGRYIETHDSRAKAVAVSPDYVAGSVGGSNDGYVLIFNKQSHEILKQIECMRSNVPDAMTFNADQSELVVSGCNLYDVEGYSVQTGRMIFQTQVDPGNWIYNFVSYNPSGTFFAVGSSDSERGTVTILNAKSGNIVETLPREHATITNLQWINDHLILASYDGVNPDGSVARVWDTNSQSMVAEFGGKHLQFTSISPDGRRLAAGIGNEVIIGNLKNKSPWN